MYGESKILTGDCRELMAELPEQHFQCCVTSPPYFGLRDYGHDGQIGLEPTPDDFVDAMLQVFGGKDNPVGVWRVLRDDGVLWLNLGDSYCNAGSSNNGTGLDGKRRGGATGKDGELGTKKRDLRRTLGEKGIKHKDLIGIPWRVAFALQSTGWYLRDAVIWHKPAPMPGSQRDRCTSSYEFIFQLTKSARYFFDLEAVKEASDYQPGGAEVEREKGYYGGKWSEPSNGDRNDGSFKAIRSTRTPRNVWKIAHEGFNDAHFATFPREIPTRCIKASTSEKGCCPACGAPWERITDRDRKPTRPGKANVSDDTGKANRDEHRHVTATRTIGWQPTCECQQTPTPCRVIDPFNGAGTTGLAANLLGRDYVGCELNPEYEAMAERRIARELRPATAIDMDSEPQGLFAP